jgi:hypothetical protein
MKRSFNRFFGTFFLLTLTLSLGNQAIAFEEADFYSYDSCTTPNENGDRTCFKLLDDGAMSVTEYSTQITVAPFNCPVVIMHLPCVPNAETIVQKQTSSVDRGDWGESISGTTILETVNGIYAGGEVYPDGDFSMTTITGTGEASGGSYGITEAYSHSTGSTWTIEGLGYAGTSSSSEYAYYDDINEMWFYVEAPPVEPSGIY